MPGQQEAQPLGIERALAMETDKMQASQEERMLSVASCLTAHMFFGLIPGLIYFLKRKESQFVAYYAAIGAMTGGVFLLAIILFVFGSLFGAATAFGGALWNSPLVVASQHRLA